jgi:hypothetical protein
MNGVVDMENAKSKLENHECGEFGAFSESILYNLANARVMTPASLGARRNLDRKKARSEKWCVGCRPLGGFTDMRYWAQRGRTT